MALGTHFIDTLPTSDSTLGSASLLIQLKQNAWGSGVYHWFYLGVNQIEEGLGLMLKSRMWCFRCRLKKQRGCARWAWSVCSWCTRRPSPHQRYVRCVELNERHQSGQRQASVWSDQSELVLRWNRWTVQEISRIREASTAAHKTEGACGTLSEYTSALPSCEEARGPLPACPITSGAQDWFDGNGRRTWTHTTKTGTTCEQGGRRACLFPCEWFVAPTASGCVDSMIRSSSEPRTARQAGEITAHCQIWAHLYEYGPPAVINLCYLQSEADEYI